MIQLAPAGVGVTDGELARAIEAMRTADARPHSVTTLRRRPWEYATSAALELVTVILNDGRSREFVLKHLGPRGASENACRAKPAFVLDPQREIAVYRTLLAPLQIGPRLIGSRIATGTDTYWLLLDRVDGAPLYEVGGLETWAGVAGWLGALHDRLSNTAEGALCRKARLLMYDREWYSLWIDRAQQFFASADSIGSRGGTAALRWLAGRYHRVVDRLLSLPPGVIHGEFYPSNVLVTGAAGALRVWPIDWEMAAIGPGLIDLAALTSGDWRDENRRAVIGAYAAASPIYRHASLDEVIESVTYAQIHLAVQWLGWFGRRRATAAHTRDWLSDAVDRAETLRI